MLVAFCDHDAGNSTPRCSNAGLAGSPMTASRISHATASKGWMPGSVNLRLTVTPCPVRTVVAVALEVMSLTGYAALFHAVFSRDPVRLSRSRSAQVAVGELGGFALVPTGLGGPALRFWALRRSGMSLRTLIVRTIAHAPIFNVPYVAAAIVLGAAALLHLGSGRAPVALAVAPAAPALLAGPLPPPGLP